MSTGMPSSAPSTTDDATEGAAALGDPELRRFLLEYVKKRVPKADADDVVQTVLLDALAATKRPSDPAELRKWVVGIARHKCADVHRRAGRERPADEELPEQPAAPSPIEERSLVQWAEEQARSTREAGKTLDWMAREGEGDKLEHIAEEEQLPPARVRQRVSRMRRFLKERWLAEVALVAALGAIALFVWSFLRKDEEPITADPTKPPESASPKGPDRVAEGQRLRVGALEVCKSGEAQRCLDDLDRAKELDPAGDQTDEVREAREKAAAQLREKQAPQQQNDAKSPPPETTKLDLDADPTSKAPAPKKPAPKPPETSTPKAPPVENKAPFAPPKAPPKSKKDAFDKDSKGSMLDLDDEPTPPAPSPSTAPAPFAESKEPPKSLPKAPPPQPAPQPAPPKQAMTKGPVKGGKPQAPTFTAPPSQAAPPPQQIMQGKK